MSKPKWYDVKYAVAQVTAPLILEFVARKSTFPGRIVDTLRHEANHKLITQKGYKSDWNTHTDDACSVKWHEILMEIHWGLEQILIGSVEDMDAATYTRYRDSMRLFGEWMPFLWD
jgi:hypothetical protein